MATIIYLEEWKRNKLDTDMKEKYKDFFATYGWLPLKQEYIVEDMIKFEQKLKCEQEKIVCTD